MICPNCGNSLPEKLNMQVQYCPMCGGRFYDTGKKYLIEIQFLSFSDSDSQKMFVLLDEEKLYEVKCGDTICFAVSPGKHSINFRYLIRNKSITILVTCGYAIGVSYNTGSGLIETNISKVENSAEGITEEELKDKKLTDPVMITGADFKDIETMLGEEEPDYVLEATTGFKEGRLCLYSEKMEFTPVKDFKKESLSYNDIVAVKKKMGAIDVECVGNVHKVYSIPKEIYNEVLAYLNNRIADTH